MTESQHSVETETPDAGASETQGIPDGMTSLAELLDAAEPDTAGAEEEQPEGGSQEKSELTMFNDLAEQLGIELDDLYKLQVKNDKGDAVTIEQLKDLHAKRSDFELEQLDWKERQLTQEQDLTRAKAELQELLALLPAKAVKPEVLEKIRTRHDAQVKQQRQETLNIIPEWKDAKVRQADIEGMSEHLQGYGFPVNYLENIVNARQLKYIRDNWQREQRVRKALEQVRVGKPAKSPAAKTQKKPPVKQPATAIQRGPARNRLQAVFSNLPE